jgi:hypothetical protein
MLFVKVGVLDGWMVYFLVRKSISKTYEKENRCYCFEPIAKTPLRLEGIRVVFLPSHWCIGYWNKIRLEHILPEKYTIGWTYHGRLYAYLLNY